MTFPVHVVIGASAVDVFITIPVVHATSLALRKVSLI